MTITEPEAFPPVKPPLDHGCLPAWKQANLPAPRPFSLLNAARTIGPGAIMLTASIGGGEWIVGPLVAVKYGAGILWIATVAIFLQMIFNLEAVRYTMYTGEPIITGFMRLRPGSKFWSVFYVTVAVVQLATPGLALGCANVVFAALSNRLPDAEGADGTSLMWIAYAILLGSALLLVSGRSIERLLEKLAWIMVVMIFTFLLVANVLFVPWETWRQTLAGFFTPGGLPENADILLLGLFAATAGSGGMGNLAVSNWVRDKGFGMGGLMGSIGGALARGHTELQTLGRVFPVTDSNLSKWRDWWRYAMLDQSLLWAVGCAVGMYLNVNLAIAIVPADADVSGYEAGAFQAKYMAEGLWAGFWTLCLLNGFWILLSTHVGNTDCLTRTVCDTLWAGYPRVQKFTASRIYAVLLTLFVAWGVVALYIGENALSLFKVLGVMASPIMAVAAVQILRVNLRFLPREIRPPVWRIVCLAACALAYGAVSVALIVDLLT